MSDMNRMRALLEKAVAQTDTRCATGVHDPTSRADVAIRRLREDRRLTLDELHRPVTF